MNDTYIENRLKDIYNIVTVIDRETEYIEDFYEFEPSEELLRNLRNEVRLMQVNNNFLLENDKRYMLLMISAVLSVIHRKKSRLSRQDNFVRRVRHFRRN